MDIINPWAEHEHEHEHEHEQEYGQGFEQEHEQEHEHATHIDIDVQVLLDDLQHAWPIHHHHPTSQPPHPDPDPALLLLHFLPDHDHPPVLIQWATTATAKAMHDALARTRHLPLSLSSPLARLLASRGSLQWQNPPQHTVSDTPHVGWRILDKDDQPKPKKPTAGLLSFWSKRSPTDPAASSARSSVSLDSLPSRAASPTKPSAPPAPSAVSRFLDRFSRPKSSSVLALSSDDLEFLSDIVPSATDDSLASLPSPAPLPNPPIPTLTPPPHLASFPPLLPPPPPPPHTPRLVSDDDEFTEFASFPPLRSPSPPSPPPRRTYEPTHYPASSSTSSSTFSPTSQSSTPSIVSSSFDDFLSSSPPPLPAKPLSQHTPNHLPTFTLPITNADRLRTQALVDHAAAHTSSWPNSPVSDHSIPAPEADLLGTGDPLLRHHLPPNPLRPTPPPLPSFTLRPIQPPNSRQTGGLSAQDLLFFEGL